MEKPTLPKGTRDFGPLQMAKRQFIMDAIRKVFQKYGFQPLETPAMENLTTLEGKYGDEGDNLLFRVLDSGEYYEKLKKLIEDANISSYRVGQLEKNLYPVLWNLARKIKGKYPRIEPEEGSTIRDEIINDESEFNELFERLEIKSEIENVLRLFIKEQLLFLPVIIIQTLKKVDSLNQIDFYSALDKSWGKGMMQILSEFSTRHFLNIALQNLTSRKMTRSISEKGLRYDLTVPFARYVVMNRGEITFPFKRYQIQPVWRADRPQKGRYREFYQCDADVVGTSSLICEAEIILMIKEVFKALNIADYTIKLNHRGILSGLAEIAHAKEKESSLFVAIDKLDKIGEEKVKEELRGKDFDEASLTAVFEILNFKGTTSQKTDFLTSKYRTSETGKKGISELNEVLSLLNSYGASDDHVEFDIALARGLSYYTGCIFEVKIHNVGIGSVSGGGRYDNLTKAFGDKENLSGVGFSFGVDRIYDALEELKLFPADAQVSSKVLVCHFDEESKIYGLKVLQALREKGVASEIYPDSKKIDKQLDYANKKMIPFTIVIGSNEVKSGVLAFKNMKKGEQQSLTLQAILDQF